MRIEWFGGYVFDFTFIAGAWVLSVYRNARRLYTHHGVSQVHPFGYGGRF
jgi:hypothetical protein